MKIRRFLSSVVDVRKGEVALVSSLFLYYYLLLLTYYFLKPSRDSLFLLNVGAQQLPIVFVLVACLAVPVTVVYSKSARRLGLSQLINVTTAILIVSLLLLWWLLGLGHSWVYYVFYTWVSIFGVLSTSQFWLFANASMNPRQAKRLFGLLTLGGILGALTGGELASFVVQVLEVPTENLLFFCLAFLAISIVSLNLASAARGPDVEEAPDPELVEEQGRETFALMLRTLFQSRQLAGIVAMLSLTMVVTTFVDVQFKTVSVGAFPEEADLTAFLGKFYGRLSLVSLLFQSLLTYRVLRVLGVGGSILFLPIGLLVASVGMFVAPVLWMGVLMRGIDGSFRYSIDKTGRELLFLPIPLEIRRRIKVFIDLLVDRWFRGVAGGVLWILTTQLQFSVRQLSLVVIFLAAIWTGLAVVVGREYVNAFRSALEKREIDPEELRMEITDASTVEPLLSALASGHERQVTYALDMLVSVKSVDLVSSVRPLLSHPSAEVRKKSLQVLQEQADENLLSEAEELLGDPDQEVRVEALRLLCQLSDGDREERLSQCLESPHFHIRLAAIGYFALYGSEEECAQVREEVLEELLATVGEDAELARVQVAKLLGSLVRTDLKKYLLKLRDDPAVSVVRQVIQSAGQTRDQEFVQWLLAKLTESEFRADARRALAAFGKEILVTLDGLLSDQTLDLSLRANIIRVFTHVPSQQAVDMLTSNLMQADPLLRYHLVKALNKLRANYPRLRFPHENVDAALIEETKSYYEAAQILQIQRHIQKENAADHLLTKAVIEKQDENLELIFRLLGLRYSPKDMFNAYGAIVSHEEKVRANAVEFLDNVLQKDLKKYVFPILDHSTVEMETLKGRELFGLRIENRDQALVQLIRGRDPWLKACALFSCTGAILPELKRLIENSRTDPDPIVRETADLVIRRG